MTTAPRAPHKLSLLSAARTRLSRRKAMTSLSRAMDGADPALRDELLVIAQRASALR